MKSRDSQITATKSSASDVDYHNNHKTKAKDKPVKKMLIFSPILSPIQSYLAHQKREIKNQEAKIEQLGQELADYTAERTLPSNSSLPCCSKCHRKEGHNRLNCPYPRECTSALFCGNIDKHPDDKQTVKQKTKLLAEERKSLVVMKEELKSREKASASVGQRYAARVKETLIESNPDKYFRHVNGKQIEDWRHINKDSKVLEKQFKSRIPNAIEARETIEEFEALSTVKKTCTGKTSVHKPYKMLWEDRGISWPRKESGKVISVDDSTDGSSPIASPQRKKVAFASHEEQDDFQLALGMQESLESLPHTFNLDKYEQDLTADKKHESEAENPKTNMQESEDEDPKTINQASNLEVLANAAMVLEIEDLMS